MKLAVLTAIVALTFPACALGQQSGSTDEPVFVAAKNAVLQQLKDPNSAQFGPLARQTKPNVRGEPTDVICGAVNARNSFGGYSGMSGFVYFVSDPRVYFADGSGPVPGLGPTVYYRFCG
ncbi:MAG TPA: hypothetical protein VJQ06_12935 [Rhizomicrobium sp.]|nr:hypothetical protein [Rhizomicrobium sp.]